MPKDARLIMYHKQATSARLRFLKLAGNTLCAFEGLPRLSTVTDEGSSGSRRITCHPGSLIASAEQTLKLPKGALLLERDFAAKVDVPGGALSIYLARFDTVDPPFIQAQAIGGSFAALTEVRDLSPAELELARRAYAYIMEG